MGSGLQGVLYVLDEPSIGLHQTDNRKLIGTLQRLRDAGNTVFVVEHDREVVESADALLDFGPAAGRLGGEIVARGTPAQVASAAGASRALLERQEEYTHSEESTHRRWKGNREKRQWETAVGR